MFYNLCMVKFSDWLKKKMEIWLDENIGQKQADFAIWLHVPPTSLSNWLHGGYKPRNDNLAIIAERYPDVYKALELPTSEVPPDQWPPELRFLFDEVSRRYELALYERGLTNDSPEAANILKDILVELGSKDTMIRSAG